MSTKKVPVVPVAAVALPSFGGASSLPLASPAEPSEPPPPPPPSAPPLDGPRPRHGSHGADRHFEVVRKNGKNGNPLALPFISVGLPFAFLFLLLVAPWFLGSLVPRFRLFSHSHSLSLFSVSVSLVRAPPSMMIMAILWPFLFVFACL